MKPPSTSSIRKCAPPSRNPCAVAAPYPHPRCRPRSTPICRRRARRRTLDSGAARRLYVPGGKAVYPSSVIMNVVPAQAAGVESLAIATPPSRSNSDGLPDKTILATCAILGVDEVYAVGGAQAIAMFAYGAKGFEPQDARFCAIRWTRSPARATSSSPPPSAWSPASSHRRRRRSDRNRHHRRQGCQPKLARRRSDRPG